MSVVIRGAVVLILVMHGAIHLLGAAKGLGWAEVAALTEPISTTGGLLWLLAAVLVVASAVGIGLGRPRWWWVAAVAALLSQALIFSAWGDAKAGTAANIVLLLAAVIGHASLGPPNQWRAKAAAALSTAPAAAEVLNDEDLVGLPVPVAEYVRQSGAVGKPRVMNFYAEVSGRIRGGPDKGWMTFTGRQVNTYGPTPQRLLLMKAQKLGVPVVVTHLFDEDGATMRGKVLSLVTIVDAAGDDMNTAETVTLFNDLLVMAPGAIPFAPVTWESIDDRSARGTFTRGGVAVSATLVFNEAFELVDFRSEDRLRASQDGSSFTRMPWNTPLTRYADVHGRKVAVFGEARWEAPGPEGHFTYIEFAVDDLVYNVNASTPAAMARDQTPLPYAAAG